MLSKTSSCTWKGTLLHLMFCLSIWTMNQQQYRKYRTSSTSLRENKRWSSIYTTPTLPHCTCLLHFLTVHVYYSKDNRHIYTACVSISFVGSLLCGSIDETHSTQYTVGHWILIVQLWNLSKLTLSRSYRLQTVNYDTWVESISVLNGT